MLLFADILVLSMSLNMRKADSQEAKSKRTLYTILLFLRPASSSPVLLLLHPIKNIQCGLDSFLKIWNSHTRVTANQSYDKYIKTKIISVYALAINKQIKRS